MNVISVIQEHRDSNDYKSEVLLIRDDDGIFKIMKEKISYPPSSGYLDEDVVMEHLSGLEFIPKFYGISKTDRCTYIRRSFMYGQPLSDYCFGKELLLEKEALFVISDIAKKLKIMEEHNILLFDVKPDNFSLSNDVNFIDLGLCRYKYGDMPFIGIMSHPRFSAPELSTKMTSKSIIFQLGLLAHELLYGFNPVDEFADESETDWGYCTVKYFNPLLFRKDIDVKDEFIKRMLSYNPSERPSITDCSEYFTPTSRSISVNRVFRPNSNTVLFPARMGIPHRGHIEYMSRLIDLGYKLIISIQRSYTLTDSDPIPKWLVAKMVAQSLFNMGYPEDCFDIYLTPFYEDDASTKLHFSTFPRPINMIASSNPSIMRHFPNSSIIRQKDVLGHENVDYEDRSWGEILRGSVKNNNYQLFKEYAASGVESILSFENIRSSYPVEDNLFVYKSGNVMVQLQDGDKVLLTKNVYRFSNPESCLSYPVKDRYTKYPVIDYGGRSMEIEYSGLSYDNDKLTITYHIRSKSFQKECVA